MTESWSTEDADNAVTAIRVILKRAGALPHVLSRAYKHEIEIGELAASRRFYEQLAVNCPDALDYFTESAAGAQVALVDRPKGSLRKIPIE
ncbi:MAG: hypothetical protein ACXV2E_08850 [Halobacteriota archaeon]